MHRSTKTMSAALAALGLGMLFVGCGGSTTTNGLTTSGATSGSSNAGAGACLASYTPNYGNTILTSSDPNVGGVLLKWSVFPIRIYFVHDANWTQALENDARVAFGTWVTSTSGAVGLQYITDSTQAMVTVNFQTQASLGGNTLGITTDSYSSNDVIRSSKMQLSSDLGDTDLRQTAAHEFGHALGISGHSPFQADLMYYAQLSTSPNTPTQRDLNTLLGDYCNQFTTYSAQTRDAGPLKTITLRTVRATN